MEYINEYNDYSEIGDLLTNGEWTRYYDDDIRQEIITKNANPGNTVNYVRTFIDGVFKGYLQEAHSQTMRDIYTTTIEHPLAAVTGSYEYTLTWEKYKEGKYSLRSDFGYLDDILEEGVNYLSRQIPLYELLRNHENLRFYDELKNVRNREDHTKDNTLIEISPTPVYDATGELLTPEAISKRGYVGNDTVLFYMPGVDGEESVTQFWFPQIPLNEYVSLVREMQALGENEKLDEFLQKVDLGKQVKDIDIMKISGEFNTQQTAKFYDFIQTKQERVRHATEENRYQIQRYLTDTLRPKLEKDTMNHVYEAAQIIADNIVVGDLNNVPEANLNGIWDSINYYQLLLRTYLKEFGYDTFNKEARQKLRASGLNFQNLSEMNPDVARNAIVAYKLTAEACGLGSEDSKSSIRINAYTGGATLMSLISSLRELYVYTCPNCHVEHSIDVPKGIFFEEICSCGEPAPERCGSSKSEIITMESIEEATTIKVNLN